MSISKEVLRFDRNHPCYAYLAWGNKPHGLFFQYGRAAPYCVNESSALKDTMGGKPWKCREEFFIYRQPHNRMVGFSSGTVDLEKLNRFWSMVERKVGAGVETVWHPTDYSSEVIVGNMSPFWFKDITAFHMMTLLLRLFCVYHKGDLYKALRSYELAWSIRKAVARYMKGYTQPTYTVAEMQSGSQSNGIVNFFYSKDGFAVKKLLVRPSVLIPDEKPKA